MGIKLVGHLLVKAKINEESAAATDEQKSDEDFIEIEVDASEFTLEEDDFRNIGDGDRQYEALYIYHGEGFKISFQATNFDGNVSMYEYRITGDADIINDELDASSIPCDKDDY